MDLRKTTRKSAKIVLEIAEAVVAGGVILMSFLWYPVLAAASAFALLMGAGLWFAQAVWAWYDSNYTPEKASGTSLRVVPDGSAQEKAGTSGERDSWDEYEPYQERRGA